MAVAAFRCRPSSGLTAGWRALLDRMGGPPAVIRRRLVHVAPAPTRSPDADASPSLPLLNAYAASAVEIARRALDLDLDAASLILGPVAVQAMVTSVVQQLEPQARRAGLHLLHDDNSRYDGVCCADADQLRAVLSHLLLRALSMEQAAGHVRVMVTLGGCEAHILVLSRTPEAILTAHAEAARDDLIAPQRLLQAMGGSLVLEPRRAGYLPICIALPALAAADLRHAA